MLPLLVLLALVAFCGAQPSAEDPNMEPLWEHILVYKLKDKVYVNKDLLSYEEGAPQDTYGYYPISVEHRGVIFEALQYRTIDSTSMNSEEDATDSNESLTTEYSDMDSIEEERDESGQTVSSEQDFDTIGTEDDLLERKKRYDETYEKRKDILSRPYSDYGPSFYYWYW